MTTVNPPVPELVVDPALLEAWRSCGAPEPRGLAGAVVADHASVVVVLPSTAAGRDWPRLCAEELGRVLGARAAEVVLVPDVGLAGMVRDWAYQAAQGSGRGVHVMVRIGDGGTDGPADEPVTDQKREAGSSDAPVVRILVRALDSSARELASRLASPTEPALAALRTLLGGARVDVIDVEGNVAVDPIEVNPSGLSPHAHGNMSVVTP
jgi:hypothetical protein